MKEKETAEKIAARAFAQSYLSDLVPAVFSNLSENGFFYDPVKRGQPRTIHVDCTTTNEKQISQHFFRKKLLGTKLEQFDLSGQ